MDITAHIFRNARSAMQNRIGLTGQIQRRSRQRIAAGIEPRAADGSLMQLKRVLAAQYGLEDLDPLGRNFPADPVAGKNRDLHGHRRESRVTQWAPIR